MAVKHKHKLKPLEYPAEWLTWQHKRFDVVLSEEVVVDVRVFDRDVLHGELEGDVLIMTGAVGGGAFQARTFLPLREWILASSEATGIERIVKAFAEEVGKRATLRLRRARQQRGREARRMASGQG